MSTFEEKINVSFPPQVQELVLSLQRAREDVIQLEIQLEIAKKSRDLLEKEWSRYKASVAPIRRCPEEILLMIFEHYLFENPRLIRHLLLVCQHWHRLTISAPRLWNRIFIDVGEEWDIKNACKSIQKWVERCLSHSQPLLLDITLDFTSIEEPGIKIRNKILDSLSGDLEDDDALDCVNDWAARLDIYALDDPDIISVCQLYHLFELLSIVVGSNGEIMARWGSLELHLPYDRSLAWEIMQYLSYPATSLNRLYSNNIGRLSHSTEDGYQYLLFTLRSLESLNIPDLLDLSLLDIQPLSVKSINFRALRSWDSVALNVFTQLQELAITFSYAFMSLESRLVGSIVTLPCLRRLILRGVFPNLGAIKFQVPVLDMLRISRASIEEPLPYPSVHALGLSLGCDAHQRPYLHYTFDQLQSYLRAILLQYQRTVYLHLPLHLKERTLEFLKELKNASVLSSCLESVCFELGLGNSETVLIEKL
ncbi:hypothetical protein M408DRAFT_119411 [Serendipita vermifera MAFF 305830]|uniref:F-box domain-containing protein n=1 Tax=Serendipita vermifera MAFF 305830 TaxID=933852 RepID=A0A0C2WTM7_SERVB|nr:hypothetical protein M408DRAFT_119411 [Serendipita vermifera MAFF 305830]